MGPISALSMKYLRGVGGGRHSTDAGGREWGFGGVEDEGLAGDRTANEGICCCTAP